MKKFKCRICGYVYYPEKGDKSQNIKADTAFENLSDNWKCPICGATKDKFLSEH